MTRYKDFEIIHGENENNLAKAVNQKLNEGYVIVGEMNIVPSVTSITRRGYEVQECDFYQRMAKIEDQ